MLRLCLSLVEGVGGLVEKSSLTSSRDGETDRHRIQGILSRMNGEDDGDWASNKRERFSDPD